MKSQEIIKLAYGLSYTKRKTANEMKKFIEELFQKYAYINAKAHGDTYKQTGILQSRTNQLYWSNSEFKHITFDGDVVFCVHWCGDEDEYDTIPLTDLLEFYKSNNDEK